MIVILYDTNCNLLYTIASNIKSGIESENKSCFLMSIGNIEYETLDLAECIIFGCKSGITPGITYNMSLCMEKTEDRYENQKWKNKFASGFTTTGIHSVKIIEDFCNFSAKHSMIWIPQGHLAENEGTGMRGINKNKSYLGCISEENDFTPFFFGKRIAQQCSHFRLL
jgi:hypothetical protein